MKPKLPTLFAGLAAAAALACSNPLGVDANEVYRSNVEWPKVGDVKDLRGGGMSWRGHDVWIRFSGTPLVRLRAHASFTEVDPRSCAEPFLRVLPEDRDVLQDAAHLKCLSFTPRGQPSSGGKVLLMNEQRQIYYFRSFK